MDRYEANCDTGEVAIIPLTAQEITAHEQDAARAEQEGVVDVTRDEDIAAFLSGLPAASHAAARRLLNL